VDFNKMVVGVKTYIMNTVLTLEETAAMLRVHPSMIYRMLKNKKLPAFKVGSDWRFNRESIDRWVVSRETVDLSGRSRAIQNDRTAPTAQRQAG
jgi:excisionase family DNA binding protein